ncbi:hypothetical protein L596_020930 [Steinernema carpocapsae]|uniref:Uncharacterized protein n=1 Tax=Steinernema carpocapsae TaxID=34508 RepID=A0A4U5MVQ7_STECR|nr:hypothetical protein L596_020930 [Steinernema carpocapsae]
MPGIVPLECLMGQDGAEELQEAAAQLKIEESSGEDEEEDFDTSEPSMIRLSEQMYKFFDNHKEAAKMSHDKLQLRDMLFRELRDVFPLCGLYIVGSSLNGFGTNGSDMDLCLMIANSEIVQKTDAIRVLSLIMATFSQKHMVREQKLIHAKVPILRVEFQQPYSNIVVDINANNAVAIKNTHLLLNYASFDWRVRPLVSVVKGWAKRCGMNDASRSTFTSYSLVLMVIHFLQCGLEKPVLPSLQELFKDKFNSLNSVPSVDMATALSQAALADWEYDTEHTLADLLIGFLRYYAHDFDYDRDAISVRLGQRTDRSYVAKNVSPYNHKITQWRCICIEEPFTLSNTAHSVYDDLLFQAIKDTFKAGYELMMDCHDLDELMAMKPIQVPDNHMRMTHFNAHVTVMERSNSNISSEFSSSNASVKDDGMHGKISPGKDVVFQTSSTQDLLAQLFAMPKQQMYKEMPAAEKSLHVL